MNEPGDDSGRRAARAEAVGATDRELCKAEGDWSRVDGVAVAASSGLTRKGAEPRRGKTMPGKFNVALP
jgi:hypothetical protein